LESPIEGQKFPKKKREIRILPSPSSVLSEHLRHPTGFDTRSLSKKKHRQDLL
jgi:hypothetical protein